MTKILAPKISQIVYYMLSIGLFILMGIAFLPTVLLSTPGVHLDDSWGIGTQLAIQNGLVFGREIVFNYGPLSFLMIRLPIGTPLWAILLFDLFIYGHIMFALVYVWRNVKSILGLLLALISLIIFAMLTPDNERLPTTVFLLFLFDLFYYLEHGKRAALLLAGFISVLTFYIKLTPGFPITLVLIIFLAYLFIRPRWHKRLEVVVLTVVYLSALGSVSLLLHTDLRGYLQGGMHVINSYNDAMFLKVSQSKQSTLYAALAVVGAYIAVILINWRKFSKDADSFARFALIGVLIFLQFKYSFVRADSAHMRVFFYSVAVCLGLLVLFEIPSPRQPIFWVFLLTLLFSIHHLTEATPMEFYKRVKSFGSYIAQAMRGDPSDPHQNPVYDAYRLPKALLERINGRTVDAIPIDIALVYINNLQYNPRPMIQSYSTYDEYLDLINFKKYASDTAPDFLLFSVGDIDDRHPFFPETKTKIAILSRYRQVDKTDSFILLEKQPQMAKCKATLVKEGEARIDRFITLPNTKNILVLRPEIEYSLVGKLVRFFYQPPFLRVTLRFKNGESQEFRAILPIVNNGVIANRLVNDPDTAEQFLQTYGEGGQNVRMIRFETRDTWGIKPKYRYRIFEVVIDPTVQVDDSVDLDACIAVLSDGADQ
jgi:hypothetical protein